MSLDTLLEAARYLELQELKEQQQRQALAPLVRTHPQPAPLPPQTQPTTIIKPKQESAVTTIHHQQQQQQQQQQSQQQSHHSHHHHQQQRVIQNSFDIINPLVIDEGGEQKRKQPPLVFRSGTREVHNKLEKHRRAHLKECFDVLKKQLPSQVDEKKTSNLSILHSALLYIQSLKRKERELEHEMERLAREKIAAQQRLNALKKEIASQCDNFDFSSILGEQSNTSDNSVEMKTQEIPSPSPPPLPPQTERATLPQLSKPQPIPNGIKENNVATTQQQPVQTTALSVVPMAGYPVSQGIFLQKLAIVPKGIAELSPLTAVSSPVAHFITAPAQQLNGKVLPVVNAQYVVKPVVVVSSPPSVAPRPS